MNPYGYFPYPRTSHGYPYPPPYTNYTVPYFAYYPPVYGYRQFPTVDPEMFMSSAKEMEVLMKDASTLLARMAESKKYSFELMSAAQESKTSKVETMLKSTGIKNVPKATYTPDGLRLIFNSSIDDNVGCCNLTLKLRWK